MTRATPRMTPPTSDANKYKGVQQFFNYLLKCEEIDRHPMEKLSQPDTPDKLVPVVSDNELTRLLETCGGKSYCNRRDVAIIRKGDRQRFIPFGERTGQAISRYLRTRSRHRAADSPYLFLAERGREPLKPNGIKIMIRRRGNAANIPHMQAHRLRHTLSHVWQREQGSESDLMAIMGWRSPKCSAATEQAPPPSAPRIPTER